MNLIPPLFAALATLDTANDDHWTADGQARVDVVSAAAGKALARQDIIDAAPTFTRQTATELLVEYRATVGELPTAAPTAPQSPEAPAPLDTRPPAPEATLGDLGRPPAPPAPSPPCESAVDLPMGQLMASVPLLEQAIRELDEQSQAKLHEQRALGVELKGLYAKSDLCAKQLARLKPKDNPANDVQTYLRRSQEARQERVRRAQAFVKAGTTPGDVRKQLATASPLDAAMSQRKPAAGSTRPARTAGA